MIHPVLPAGHARSVACRYCIYSLVQNGFFAPQGRHIPLNVKFGMGADRSNLARAKFHVSRTDGQKQRLLPPSLVRVGA